MGRVTFAAVLLALAACGQPEPPEPAPATMEAFGTGAPALDGAAKCLVAMQVWAQHKRDGHVPAGVDPAADEAVFNAAASRWAGVYDRERIANDLSEMALSKQLKIAFDEARARGPAAVQSITQACVDTAPP